MHRLSSLYRKQTNEPSALVTPKCWILCYPQSPTSPNVNGKISHRKMFLFFIKTFVIHGHTLRTLHIVTLKVKLSS